MTQLNEKVTETMEGFESAYLELSSIPLIDLSPEARIDHYETLRELSVSITKMETANLSRLKAAFEAEGQRIKESLEAMQAAIQANTDASTLLYSVEHAFDMAKHFLMLL